MKLITGGIVVDPGSNRDGEFDLLIADGKVHDVGPRGSFASATVSEKIDANGCWVVPGLVDVHVHLREPGFEWKETIHTGANAAVLGGYTSICCMPNTKPTNDNAEITRFIIEKAKSVPARVLPIGAVSLGLKGEQMAPLMELRKAGCVAFSDDGEPVWSAGMMRRALEWASELAAPICCHEEDKSLSAGGCMNESPLSFKLGLKGITGTAEDVMVSRDIELARLTGGRVHICHVSTARSTELIRRAKNDGIAITAEVTPHHLLLTEDAIGDYDTRAKMNPPLRESVDRDGVLAGLADGTLDAIASDHAPHEEDSKQVEFSKATFGIIGLQTSLGLMMDLFHRGTISRKRLIEALSTAPARSLGLSAGSLAKGAAADLVILDPAKRWTISPESVVSLSKNSPFYGREVQGVARTTLVGGRVVVRNGALVSE